MFFLLGTISGAQETRSNYARVRFLAVDIFVDSKGEPLAAYQLEFSATNGPVKIVGIEGGEHSAFREAPHYDPKAIQQDRGIIAAFSTEPHSKLPTGRTRVATIHIQVNAGMEPQFALNLQAAADPSGHRLTVSTSATKRETQ